MVGDSDAMLVDTDHYGYEATEPISAGPNGVSSYREENKNQTVYKIRSFKGWASTDAGAAAHGDG